MKIEILFAVASIMLIDAALVLGLPTLAQAAKQIFCTDLRGDFHCFNGNGLCEKFVKENPAYGQCQKRSVPN
ncbi:MAG TPA: hypothetical protein VI146_05825 [Nitrososphaeraceae archaeon]